MLIAFKMKKAELSFETIVTALIVVLVFVVLVIIFRKQLSELLRPITEAIKGIGELG